MGKRSSVSVARFYIVLVLILFVGIVLSGRLWTPSWWPHLESIGDALIIAAILAFTVDRFVKEHFIYEVSADVFHYIIGYDVPPEIKQRIKELLHVTVIAADKRVVLRIEAKTRTTVSVHATVEWHVRNLTDTKHTYTPKLAVLRADRPVFLSHRVVSRGKINYSFDEDAIRKHISYDIPAGVEELRGQTFDLEPSAVAGDYVVKWEYTVIQPKEHYHVEGFGIPTLGASVIVSHPSEWDVTVIGDLKQVGNEWSTDRLFQRGEFITIQWRHRVGGGGGA